jgi:hypothetical protein
MITWKMHLPTFVRRIYSLINGAAGCSKLSSNTVKGDVVSLRLRSLEIRSKLWVRRCDKFAGGIMVL